MEHVKWEQIAPKSPHPGVTTRRFDSEGMTITRYEFKPGARFPVHSHPEEQVVIINRGPIAFTVGDRVLEMGPGEICHIKPNVPHGARAADESVEFVCLLSPRRAGETLVYRE